MEKRRESPVRLPAGMREIATFAAAKQPLFPPLEESVRECVAEQVAAGYLGARDLVAYVISIHEDQAPRAEIRRIAKLALVEAKRAHEREQTKWPKVTDCDRLDRAFDDLGDAGVLSRQNYWCCATCGSAAISDEMRALKKKRRRVLGYTFFHEQDTEQAVREGKLLLSYGAVTGEEEDSVKIGEQVVRALMAAGLKPRWNGKLDSHIRISLKWRRRPDPALRSSPRRKRSH